jgi:hypothetical protein
MLLGGLRGTSKIEGGRIFKSAVFVGFIPPLPDDRVELLCPEAELSILGIAVCGVFERAQPRKESSAEVVMDR